MKDKIESMEDGKDKELMKILEDGAKPYIKKQDGLAIKVSEDKEIKYKDYEGNENTLSVPAGSYIVTEGESCYPKIVTAEDWESKNKFIGEDKPTKKVKSDRPKIGIELMEED